MPNSPFTWGSSGPKALQGGGVQLLDGQLLRNDGMRNYVRYMDAETGLTTGWSLGTVTLTSAFPSGVPTFGSGASGNLSLSVSSSSPIAGTYSYVYDSSVATTVGNFVASDALTIDAADQAKSLQFRFYYTASANASNANWSGTSSNSFGVAIYDVTNSAWIQPSGVFNIVQSSGVGIASGTFQTSASGTQYRLVIYNANATAGAITLKLDRFFLGPQPIATSPAMSDWVLFTPTGSWSTNTTYTGAWRRIGDSMQIRYKLALAGAPTAAALTVNMPSGYSIDTSKLLSTSNSAYEVHGKAGVRSAANFYTGHIYYNSATAFNVATIPDAAASTHRLTNVTNASPGTFASGDAIEIEIDPIPILGWSSNSVSSAESDTRVVALNVTGPTSGSITTGSFVDIAYATVNQDTHAAYNTGTGTYTVVVPGFYNIAASIAVIGTGVSGASEGIRIQKNSTAITANIPRQPAANSGNAAYNASVSTYLNTGDTIKAQVYTDRTSATYNGGLVSPTLSLTRVGGAAVVQATESVNMRYFASATSISGTAAAITYTSKDFDTHNAYSGSTFTVPVSGKYQVNASITIGATFTIGQVNRIYIYKNGSEKTRNFITSQIATTHNLNVNIADIVQCNAGDTIQIFADSGGTTPSILSSNFLNFVSISRVGN